METTDKDQLEMTIWSEHAQLYKKDQKEIQNRPMETSNIIIGLSLEVHFSNLSKSKNRNGPIFLQHFGKY